MVDFADVDNELTSCPVYDLYWQNTCMLEALARRERLSTRLDTK